MKRPSKNKPGFADANYNYGNLLAEKGQTNEAVQRYEQALSQKPDNAGAHNNLASLLLHEGKMNEAISHLQRALELRPNLAEARENLNTAAWTLATSAEPSKRDGKRAVALAGQLVKLSNGTDPAREIVVGPVVWRCRRATSPMPQPWRRRCNFISRTSLTGI